MLVAAVPHGAAAQETVLELRPGAPIRLVAPSPRVLPTTPWFIPAKAAGPEVLRGVAPGPGRPRARTVAKAAPKSAARAVAKGAPTAAPMPAPTAAPGAKTVQAVAPPAGSAISPPGPRAAAPAAPPGSLIEVIGTVLQQPLPAAAGPVPDALRAEAVVFLQGGPDLGVAAYQHDGWAILVLDQPSRSMWASCRPVRKVSQMDYWMGHWTGHGTGVGTGNGTGEALYPGLF